MGYLLLSIFLVIFSMADYFDIRKVSIQETAEINTITNQRAIETVNYINAINDYLYDHPDVLVAPGSLVLSDSQIGISVSSEIKHVIEGKRVFVWQNAEKGLMNALKVQTFSSALLGVVKGRRLIDNGNVDMGVSVPSQIPEGAIVYLN
jgi:hypothetical protein